MNSAAITSFVVAMLMGAVTAAAPDRTAVFISSGVGTDTTLADNLTEVAIAKLAEREPGERVGTHELRRWLERNEGAEPAPACISRVACLRRLGAALGIRKLVSGSVLADRGEFTIALALVDADSGVVEATATRTVGGELEQVIQAVQEAVIELLRPARPSLNVEPVAPPASPPAVVLSPAVVRDARHVPSLGRRWPFYAGLGAAAASVLSMSAGGVFGVLAWEEPTGKTRAEAQRDLGLRDSYASAANALWIVGGVLAAASVAMFSAPRSRGAGP